MKVEVRNESGKVLTFEASEDTQIDDQVQALVDTFWMGGSSMFVGRVVSLGSDYNGRCVKAEKIVQ